MTSNRKSENQSNFYYSYVVRLWQEQPNTPWRASAQSVLTGETHRFGDLESLCAFLLRQGEPSQQPKRAQSGFNDDAG